MKYHSRRKEHSPFPGAATLDVYSNLVFAFAVLFILAIIGFNVEAGKDKKEVIPGAAQFVIRMEWPGESRDDMDLYVRDPVNHFVYFRRLSDGLLTLDHDDTGSMSNSVTTKDGRVVNSMINEEKVEIRGIIEGEYVVNVQAYSKVLEDPTTVSVILYKMAGGSAMKIIEKAVVMYKKGDEVTAFRFTLTKDGDVIDVNQLPVKFVGTHYTERSN